MELLLLLRCSCRRRCTHSIGSDGAVVDGIPLGSATKRGQISTLPNLVKVDAWLLAFLLYWGQYSLVLHRILRFLHLLLKFND